jgi:hypothetical protein
MANIKCPYTYPHRSRKAKADFICGIGGYYNRDGRWPIEFTVGLDGADLGFDHLWALMVSEKLYSFPKIEFDLVRAEAEKVYKEIEGYLWEWGQEGVCDQLDSDYYRTLWDGTVLDIKFSLQGRGGKHLVIDSFEGTPLKGYTDTALHEAIMLQYAPSKSTSEKERLLKGGKWDIEDEWVDKLYRYCRQAVIELTTAKASRELEYQCAFLLADRTDIAVERRKAELAQVRTLEQHAKLVYERMSKDGESLNALYALCEAAGVSPSEVTA